MADYEGTASRGPNPTVFLFQLAIGAVILVYLGWWGYSNVMEYALGRFDVFDFGGAPSQFFGKSRVLLVDPVRTELWLADQPEDTTWPYRMREDPWRQADTLWYAEGMKRDESGRDARYEAFEIIGSVSEKTIDLAGFWEDALYKRNYEYRIIEETDLVNMPEDYKTLILPGCILLSKREKDAIKDFLADGGSVLIMYLPGVRDERGNWVGHQFTQQLIGGIPSHQVEDVSGGTNFVIKGMLPLTRDIAPGAHLDSYTYWGYTSYDIVEPRTTSDASWFFPYWRTNHSLASGANSMLAHGTYLGGRFVWFGFAPETIQGNYDNQIILDKLVENSFDYLDREPIVVPKVWPAGYRAGGSILLEAQGNPDLARRAMAVAQNVDITVDLIAPEEFSQTEVSFGDVLYGDLFLSTGRFDRLSELPLKDQSDWVEQNVEQMSRVMGTDPVGLFPYDWLYNEETLQAAARFGLTSLLGEPIPRAYGAQPHNVKPRSWWIFSPNVLVNTAPKSQLTLWEWRKLRGITGEGRLMDAMESDMRRIARAGGYYSAILDPEVMLDMEALTFPAKVAESMDSLGIWRTNTTRAMERYSAWRGLRASGADVSGTRIRLNISNEGRFDMTDVVFDLYLPGGFQDVDLSTRTIGTSAHKIRFSPSRSVCTFSINQIGANENIVVFADLIRSIPTDTLRQKELETPKPPPNQGPPETPDTSAAVTQLDPGQAAPFALGSDPAGWRRSGFRP